MDNFLVYLIFWCLYENSVWFWKVDSIWFHRVNFSRLNTILMSKFLPITDRLNETMYRNSISLHVKMDHVCVCVNRNEPNTTLELRNYKKLYMQGQIVTVEIAHIWSRLCSNFTLFGALTTFTKKTRLEGYDGPPYLEGSNDFPRKLKTLPILVRMIFLTLS